MDERFTNDELIMIHHVLSSWAHLNWEAGSRDDMAKDRKDAIIHRAEAYDLLAEKVKGMIVAPRKPRKRGIPSEESSTYRSTMRDAGRGELLR